VQVLYDEDVASHIAPRPCVVSREGQGEASAGDRAGWPSSHESGISRAPTGLPTWKATRLVALSRVAGRLGVVRDPSMHGRSVDGNREISLLAKGPKPAMNGDEKSDPTIVAKKPANEPLRRGQEWVERRVGAEGNVEGPHGVRAQDRAASPSGIDRGSLPPGA
jgi:hypothetical protein